MAALSTQPFLAQSARLQKDFLQLPDGRCSLPVAYTLTYIYLGRGKLKDWLGVLDAKLADPALTGNLRVNWLLARAQAQEFTRRAIMHYPFRFGYPFLLTRDGQVIGFWRTILTPEEALMEVHLAQPLDAASRSALETELERYGRFLQLPARLLVKPRAGRGRRAQKRQA